MDWLQTWEESEAELGICSNSKGFPVRNTPQTVHLNGRPVKNKNQRVKSRQF